MKIVFAESTALNDAVFGKWQGPIQLFIEERGEAAEQESVIKHIFTMGESKNYGDSFTGMTAMDDFVPTGELGAYPQTGMQQGYSQSMEYIEWLNSFRISKKIIEDSKLLELKAKPRGFIQAWARTRERFGAALFGNAIKGNGTAKFNNMDFNIKGADKSNLFAVNHKPKVKGAVQSNMFADAFSADALGRAETAMHLFRGDDDNILDVAPTTIMIPDIADLKKAVFAVIGADKDPATANNGFNYQFGRWRVIVWSYLNQFITPGTQPWILLDENFNETYGGAIWNDRIPLQIESYIDHNTTANVWNGRGRFNACFNDFRFACVGGITGGTDLSSLKL